MKSSTNERSATNEAHSLAARYRLAKTLSDSSNMDSCRPVAYNTLLHPHWIGDTDCFWYRRETIGGHSFQRVDAKASTNTPAFDHKNVAQVLSAATNKTLTADNLPLLHLELSHAPQQITFTAFEKRWLYDSSHKTCSCLYTLEKIKRSPDGKLGLFTRDYNLWVRDMDTGNERALTTDGERFYSYADTPVVWGVRACEETVEALWSADSTRILTLVIDTRNVGVGMPLVDHVPSDGSLRPRILDPERRVAYPGDDNVDVYRFLSIALETGATQFADTADCPITFMPYIGFFTGFRAWWDKDNRHAFFVEEERGMKAHRLVRFDTQTGTVNTVIEETSDFHVMLIPSTHVTPLFIPLPDSNEVIWYTERSGTAHFYLYDTLTGQLKNTITQGDWIVRNGVFLDKARRELTVQTASRVEGRNPYYCDICRVNIDTGELTELLSTDHEYIVCDQRSRPSLIGGDSGAALGVSPTANFIVTTRSRVDQLPVSLLLDRDGNEVMVLERTEAPGLPDNCTWPEPVMLKAEDGKTDIYSVVFRPSNLDSTKSYPIIDATVNYCSPVGSFNCGTGYYYLRCWAMAELGFIVVVVFNRGSERLRDKAFNEYTDPAYPVDPAHMLNQYNNDCVAGIKQLAERYPYMDINRVGVTEFGHTPRALAGLFLHPEFYKVGVSVNPDADRRIMSSQGLDFRGRDVKQFEHLVDQFDGKLLMIAHLLDRVSHASATFRLAHALHHANKRFDMLILPEEGHPLSGNALLRAWDYLVEHLQGLEPPKTF